jgi:hypothetical protein
MRKELQNIEGVRQRFTATFVRYGTKPAYKGPPIKTLLFEDIRDKHGKEYCDHLWFTINKSFTKLDLQPGEKISFDARVKPYIKGYRGRRGEYDENFYDAKPVSKDYKLSHPNNIVKHSVGAQGQLF